MSYLICFCVAALATVLLTVRYLRYLHSTRRHYGQIAGFFMLVALLDSFLLFLPYYANFDLLGINEKLPWWMLVPYLLTHMLQINSLDASYETALLWTEAGGTFGQAAAFQKLYVFVLSYLSAAVPILGVLAVSSVFYERIRYWWVSHLTRGKTFQIFNGIGRGSVALAEDLAKEQPGSRIIFCNVDLDDLPTGREMDELIAMGAVFTQQAPPVLLRCAEYRWAPNRLNYLFVLEEDQNLEDAMQLLDTIHSKAASPDGQERDWPCAERVQIRMMGKTKEAEGLLDARQKHGVQVRMMDYGRTVAYDLYRKYPLFMAYAPEKPCIRQVVIGDNPTAREIFLEGIWLGQMQHTYSTSVYIGPDADTFQDELRVNCPGLQEEDTGRWLYPMQFLKVNCGSVLLDSDARACVLQSDYLVVATADDEDNIKYSVNLRSFICRKIGQNSDFPFMLVYVRDNLKADKLWNISVLESKVQYNFLAFGSDRRTFSVWNILSNRLEEMTVGVQLTYMQGGAAPEQARRELNGSTYNYASSEAAAMYLAARLFDSGLAEKFLQECGLRSDAAAQAAWIYRLFFAESRSEESSRAFSVLEERFRALDDNTLELLAQAEHARWNAYMRVLGWTTMPPEKILPNMERCGNDHKNYITLEHPCITDWEELTNVSAIVSERKKGRINRRMYQDYDLDMVRNLFRIAKPL